MIRNEVCVVWLRFHADHTHSITWLRIIRPSLRRPSISPRDRSRHTQESLKDFLSKRCSFIRTRRLLWGNLMLLSMNRKVFKKRTIKKQRIVGILKLKILVMLNVN